MKNDELKWNWVYCPYLDAPNKQEESALKAGYVKVVSKDDVDEAIAELRDENATLRGANEEKTARIIELQKQVDELDGVKKSAEQILQNLLDCGLIKEWYFNGKFNAILKADDPHLKIAELKQKLQDQCISCPVKKQEDDVVADKDEEIYNIKYSRDEWAKACNQKDKEIAELKANLEDAKATAYTESVDAGMRERRLRRALWLARAERAKEMCRRLLIQGFDPKWENVERKCLKKAKEYK